MNVVRLPIALGSSGKLEYIQIRPWSGMNNVYYRIQQFVLETIRPDRLFWLRSILRVLRRDLAGSCDRLLLGNRWL